MPHDPEKYLYDASQAAKLITKFIENKGFSDYISDQLLQSGVERQLIIAGEALNKRSKISPRPLITNKLRQKNYPLPQSCSSRLRHAGQ